MTKETSRRIELAIRRVHFRNRRAETTKRRVEHFVQDLPSYGTPPDIT